MYCVVETVLRLQFVLLLFYLVEGRSDCAAVDTCASSGCFRAAAATDERASLLICKLAGAKRLRQAGNNARESGNIPYAAATLRRKDSTSDRPAFIRLRCKKTMLNERGIVAGFVGAGNGEIYGAANKQVDLVNDQWMEYNIK